MGAGADVAAGTGRDRGGRSARCRKLRAWPVGPDQSVESEADQAAQEQRALRFALAEYDVKTYEVRAGDNLGTVLA